MQRILVVLCCLLLCVGVGTLLVSAETSHHTIENVPHPADCPPQINCLFTPSPVPHGGGSVNPGDPDGDGIPNGIDQCPNQGGPSSNAGCPPGVTGSIQPTAVASPAAALPTMPISGDCVLATRGSDGVNVRGDPSVHANVVGVLDPQTLYPVIAQLENAEGLWDRIAQGWVARWVVREGGDCEGVPVLDAPGAADAAPITLSYPDGFALALDKGDAPGQDTPQGYCSPRFGVDWGDGSAVHFDFGASTRCITLDADQHGFQLVPPDPCTPAEDATTCPDPFLTHWFVGFDPQTNTPELVSWLSDCVGGSSQPDGSATDQLSALVSWSLIPPGPCKQGDQSCASPPINFTVRWSLIPPGPCKSGDTSCPSSPNLTLSWALENANENQPSFTISWLPGSNSGFEYGGFSLNFEPPPDPDFQGFGIEGVDGIHADIAVHFQLPAVQAG